MGSATTHGTVYLHFFCCFLPFAALYVFHHLLSPSSASDCPIDLVPRTVSSIHLIISTPTDIHKLTPSRMSNDSDHQPTEPGSSIIFREQFDTPRFNGYIVTRELGPGSYFHGFNLNGSDFSHVETSDINRRLWFYIDGPKPGEPWPNSYRHRFKRYLASIPQKLKDAFSSAFRRSSWKKKRETNAGNSSPDQPAQGSNAADPDASPADDIHQRIGTAARNRRIQRGAGELQEPPAPA